VSIYEEIAALRRANAEKSRRAKMMAGSVMGRPSEEWQPDYQRKGGHALEAPMVSPDDLIGSGIGKPLAALAKFGAAKAASIPAIGLAGTFIGRGSPMFRTEAADAAQAAFRAGATPKQVWKTYPHNWVLPDGTIAQEIDDSTAKIVAPWLPDMDKLKAERDRATQAFIEAQTKYKAGEIDYPTYEPFVRARLKAENDVVTPTRTEVGNMPLSQFYQHPELYKAVPELANIDLKVNPHTKTSYHDPAAGLIEIGTKGAENQQSLLGVVAHEGQHPIQDIQGWATGGSPDLFAGLQDSKRRLQNFMATTKSPEDMAVARAEIEKLKQYPGYRANSELDAYRRLFGEQMAYSTQRRANMNMDERAANFPGDAFEFPVEETIWRRGGQMSYPPFANQNAGGYGDYVEYMKKPVGETIVHTGVPTPDTLAELERRRRLAMEMQNGN